MRNIFVTAIGTDSGKTVVSAILTKALSLDYWKPIQSGWPTDSETIMELTNGAIKIHPEQYKFKTPASPHYAAEIENQTIRLEGFKLPKNENLLIEGAGGLMVPLNDQYLMIDLIQKLDCDVVLASNIYLGSINHTLLALEALKNRNIKLKYIVFNGPSTPSTERIIEDYAQVPVLLRLRPEDKITADVIDRYATEIRV